MRRGWCSDIRRRPPQAPYSALHVCPARVFGSRTPRQADTKLQGDRGSARESLMLRQVAFDFRGVGEAPAECLFHRDKTEFIHELHVTIAVGIWGS